MLVQAVDGKFYRNPVVSHPTWLLEANRDGVFIKRKGNAQWATARRPLKAAGIKFVLEEICQHESVILESKLVKAAVFRIQLRGAIPIPQRHQGVLDDAPTAKELDMMDECLLSWPNQ
jgi:hypothetical protein